MSVQKSKRSVGDRMRPASTYSADGAVVRGYLSAYGLVYQSRKKLDGATQILASASILLGIGIINCQLSLFEILCWI